MSLQTDSYVFYVIKNAISLKLEWFLVCNSKKNMGAIATCNGRHLIKLSIPDMRQTTYSLIMVHLC